MKKILFRGKTEKSKWVEGNLVFDDKGSPFIIRVTGNEEDLMVSIMDIPCVIDYVIPETVGQYTGKNDIQGNEIFGGDIVSYENNLYEVFYDEKDAAFCLKRFATMVRGIYNKVLVIGNRTDNPELLDEI